ncbi:sensor histidine kinase [Paenibacillus sp. EC2-1]|uniref:sensor histidine kinase n=1 Tax=Paenibacillus sp. EC2-1 TaxID=3388665 RepID=UPI003BEF066B
MKTKLVLGSRNRRGYIPIGYKLMMSYLIFIIILVTVNGYVSHSMYDSSMRDQTSANIQSTLIQIRDNVLYKTEDMWRISSTIYDDEYFVEKLKRKTTNSNEEYVRLKKELFPKLDSVSKSIGINLRLFLYTNNDTMSEIYYTYKPDSRYEDQQTYNIYQMDRIQDKAWYNLLSKEEYGITKKWMEVEDDKDSKRISMIRRIIDLQESADLWEQGIMRFSVSKNELFQSVDYRKLGKGAKLYVQNRAGQIIYASEEIPSSSFQGNESNVHTVNSLQDNYPADEFLTLKEYMPKEDWTIVAHVPLTIIKQEAERVRAFIIGVCIVCFVLFTSLGIYISRYFSKRMMKFVSILNSFREGDLRRRITYKGKDEFSQIATALNEMGEDFEMLIEKVYLTELAKKEAELEMLQTQINPHFLYNTLSSINQLAKFGENEKLRKMVVELAKFYRLTLNSGRMFIPVSSEIEQVNAYLDIQKVKYGNRLGVTYDIDVDVWKYETIKLILQPFVENALKHAWSGADHIHIRIVARIEKGEILYRVIDDGMGVSQASVNELLNTSEVSETGFGIRNIHQRVQLQYGEQYGVSIFSRVGIGTSVDIRLPAKKRRLFLDGE